MKKLLFITAIASAVFVARTGFTQNSFDFGLPSASSEKQIALSLEFDQNTEVTSLHSFSRIHISEAIEEQLYSLGYPNNLHHYSIISISFRAKGFSNRGQVRLCSYSGASDPCTTVFSQYNLESNSLEFQDEDVWFTYPLFTGIRRQDIGANIDIEFIGHIKIESIKVVLESNDFK